MKQKRGVMAIVDENGNLSDRAIHESILDSVDDFRFRKISADRMVEKGILSKEQAYEIFGIELRC